MDGIGASEDNLYELPIESGIENISLPDTIEFIENFAFRAFNRLTSITIPEGTSIAMEVLGDMSSIKTVYYKGTKQQWRQLGNPIPSQWWDLICSDTVVE